MDKHADAIHERIWLSRQVLVLGTTWCGWQVGAGTYASKMRNTMHAMPLQACRERHHVRNTWRPAFAMCAGKRLGGDVPQMSMRSPDGVRQTAMRTLMW